MFRQALRFTLATNAADSSYIKRHSYRNFWLSFLPSILAANVDTLRRAPLDCTREFPFSRIGPVHCGRGLFVALPMSQLQELITPAQSQILVIVASILLTLIGAIWGFVAARARGLVAALGGPLVFVLWLAHGALTAKFGMDSLWLLLAEAAFVVFAGAALGLAWSAIIGTKREEQTGEIQLEKN